MKKEKTKKCDHDFKETETGLYCFRCGQWKKLPHSHQLPEPQPKEKKEAWEEIKKDFEEELHYFQRMAEARIYPREVQESRDRLGLIIFGGIRIAIAQERKKVIEEIEKMRKPDIQFGWQGVIHDLNSPQGNQEFNKVVDEIIKKLK